MSNEPSQRLTLQKDLIKLKERGAVVIADLRRSNAGLYKYLCELYFWWRSANEQDDYLEQQYATLGRKFKTVGYGINFSPLLWLALGDNNLDRNSVDRYSRAMNAVHKEYERQPELYEKDGVAKLANYISQSGGTTKLAGYAPPDDTPADESSNGTITVNSKLSNNEPKINKALLELTYTLEEFSQKRLLPSASYLKSSPEKFSVLLVQHTADGLNVIENRTDTNIVETILADNLRRRFDVSVFAIRPLLELIQTQCLPKQLEGMVEKLIDKTRLKDEANKQFTSYRRVLYKPSTNEFILSPINAVSGVVSTVQPFFPLILADCQKDVFLPVAERAILEERLLRGCLAKH